MYGLVLATVMTVGGTTPAWNCHGCYGCYGSWGSCYGCSGYAFGCHGCHGYNAFSCHGCYGCMGCYGCYGCAGCYGCYGCMGCYGCYGCSGCYGATVVYYPSATMHGMGGGGGMGGKDGAEKEIRMLREQVEALQKQIELMKKKGTEETRSGPQAGAAQVTVTLPGDATMYIDNVLCPLTSNTRSFKTPTLQPGQKYYYTVRAEVVRGGTKLSQSQKVVLEAGQQVTVEFGNLTPVATSQR